MQKFYLKIKDKWWVIILTIFITWAISGLLDSAYSYTTQTYDTTFLHLSPKFMEIWNKQVSLYYIVSIFVSFILGYSIVLAILYIVKRNKIKTRALEILHATYGKNENQIDITNELNNSVSGNVLNIVLSNNIAGDPCYGIRKIGKVRYRYNGEIHDRDYVEGEVIVLPTPLFEAQIQAIVSLLSSFGVEREKIIGVEKVLRGMH